MLKKARKEAKITQVELARRTATKKSCISRIERGQSDIRMSPVDIIPNHFAVQLFACSVLP
ncbi:MAG: helix-turn-helix domain-containing protein [Cyclonatronaceae bacterium]